METGTDAGTGNLRSSPEPLLAHPKAISVASTARNRIKGMRRRAAKLLAHMQEQQQQCQQELGVQAEDRGTDATLAAAVQDLQCCCEQADMEGVQGLRFAASLGLTVYFVLCALLISLMVH